jgi:hypothetical protein
MKKSLWTLFGILVAIPIVLILGTVIFIDPLVKAGVERGASAALKVPVHLNGVSVRFSGSADLTGFDVGNPPGYAEPRSIAFDRVNASVQPSSLLKDVVHVGEVTLVKPEVTMEFAGTKSNWSALMDNLAAEMPKSEPKEPPKDSGAPAKKFIIHKIRIEEAAVKFRSDLIPGGAKSVTLPTIELHDIGTAEGGATMGQVLNTILHSLGDSALKAGQGVVPTELLNSLGSTINKGVKAVEKLPSKSIDELKKAVPDKEKTEKGVKDVLHNN